MLVSQDTVTCWSGGNMTKSPDATIVAKALIFIVPDTRRLWYYALRLVARFARGFPAGTQQVAA